MYNARWISSVHWGGRKRGRKMQAAVSRAKRAVSASRGIHMVQGLSVTGALAYSLLACKRHRVPLIWILIGALWAAVNPFLQVLSFGERSAWTP